MQQMWVALKDEQVALAVDNLLYSHLLNTFFLQHRTDRLSIPNMAEIQRKMNKVIPAGIIMDSTLRYLSFTVKELDWMI